MFSLQRVLSKIRQSANLLPALKSTTLWSTQTQTSNFHSLTQPRVDVNFLTPTLSTVIQSAGFKIKGVLRRRCKDCFFVRRDNRMHVICKTHRRHKQKQMQKDDCNTWDLTHATQGKVRGW